ISYQDLRDIPDSNVIYRPPSPMSQNRPQCPDQVRWRPRRGSPLHLPPGTRFA
ncbi:hypothetical protein BKA93DRAFT_771178, partial [Sparassis latifolia]